MRKFVSFFKKVLQRSTKKAKERRGPTIIKRDQHPISRRHISKSALKVLYRLHKAGFSAYLVGGSVRDLLLGLYPKDFDVATNAHPEQIQRLFKNSFIIGRRFRLVHVRFGQEIIEVATFRGEKENATGRVRTKQGLLLRDNVYGTLEDDVWRRDFTVNALYYNIADFSVIDFTQGVDDLHHRSIRVIGNPEERYREDPARMLRAIRLAAKLNFTIEPDSLAAIRQHKELIAHVPSARLFDKMLKIFYTGNAYAVFKLFSELDVLAVLFPALADAIKEPEYLIFVEEALRNTDQRIKQNKTISPAFVFAVLLWTPLQQLKDKLKEEVPEEVPNEHQAFNAAMIKVIQQQLKIIAIPRKFTIAIREIWQLQYHLQHARAKRINKIFHHERFRAAFDFLGVRAKAADGGLGELYGWWAAFQEGDEEARNRLIQERFFSRKTRQRKKKKVEQV